MLVTTDWTEGADGSGLEAFHFHCEECGMEWKDYADDGALGTCPRCSYSDHDNWLSDTDDSLDFDDMDGDHESALASAGFGTDEDYGCFDGGLDDF